MNPRVLPPSDDVTSNFALASLVNSLSIISPCQPVKWYLGKEGGFRGFSYYNKLPPLDAYHSLKRGGGFLAFLDYMRITAATSPLVGSYAVSIMQDGLELQVNHLPYQ